MCRVQNSSFYFILYSKRYSLEEIFETTLCLGTNEIPGSGDSMVDNLAKASCLAKHGVRMGRCRTHTRDISNSSNTMNS